MKCLAALMGRRPGSIGEGDDRKNNGQKQHVHILLNHNSLQHDESVKITIIGIDESNRDFVIDANSHVGLNTMQGPDDKMGSVSQLLVQVREQDGDAKRKLFALIYEELRGMAGAVLRGDGAERSLQATELVHEAVLRLLDPTALDRAQNRRYLFAACCRAMRQILVDHSRVRNADKRGGDCQRHDFDIILDEYIGRAGGDLVALNQELDNLEQTHPRLAEVVNCRFFGGMSVVETAELLAVSEKTVHRDWRLAKAMLKKALAD